MNTLPAVNSIPGPSISGSVQVPLAELDKMRSDHANALKLAQELEHKQKQIKISAAYTEHIVVEETDFLTQGNSLSSNGGLGAGYQMPTKRFVNKAIEKEHVTFLNLDDVLGALKADATKIVKKETDIIIAALNKAEKAIVTQKKKASDDKKVYTKAIDKKKTRIEELEEQVEAAEAKMALDKETIDDQENQLLEAVDSIVEAKEEVTKSMGAIKLLKRRLADNSFSGKVSRFFS